jgi:geranylgeranyl transferase type-1 subunit beta
LDDCTRWIIDRQTTHLEEDESENEEQTSEVSQYDAAPLPSSPLGFPHTAQFPAAPSTPPKPSSSKQSSNAKAPILNVSEKDLRWAGFNGRPNKIADTCYCFWNIGALAVGSLKPL